MNTVGDYHDLYVKSDALILCDAFERFREMTVEYYKLDACHFFSAPGLQWQAALKMSKVCLDLIVDPIMYNMFELGTRGGVSMVSKKYSKANDKYLDDLMRLYLRLTSCILRKQIYTVIPCNSLYLRDL